MVNSIINIIKKTIVNHGFKIISYDTNSSSSIRFNIKSDKEAFEILIEKRQLIQCSHCKAIFSDKELNKRKNTVFGNQVPYCLKCDSADLEIMEIEDNEQQSGNSDKDSRGSI